jgi:hypothetical protein
MIINKWIIRCKDRDYFPIAEKESILFADFLKRQSFVTVKQMYDAAILVAVTFQTLSHDNISLVGINADISHLILAILQ